MASALINVPKRAKRGEIIEIKTLMSHIMETGYRHTATGEVVPRDIITSFVCRYIATDSTRSRPRLAADKAGDDVARNDLAGGGMAVAGLHDVRHQRLDLDDLAAFCPFRNVDQRRCHQITSSVQAANVTTTSTLVDQNESSDSRAMATIF